MCKRPGYFGGLACHAARWCITIDDYRLKARQEKEKKRADDGESVVLLVVVVVVSVGGSIQGRVDSSWVDGWTLTIGTAKTRRFSKRP